MTDTPDTSREAIEAKLRNLPSEGRDWYVEHARPGHIDEARVYDRGHWGVAKPTNSNHNYWRPTAEWVAESPALVRALLTEREAALRLAKEATNGWAVYAKRQAEHDDIARLHREIGAIRGKEGA